jgi:hypothetical protein
MDAAWPKDSRPYQARNTGIKTRAGVSFTRRLWETEGVIDVRFGSLADICIANSGALAYVCFGPKADILPLPRWRCGSRDEFLDYGPRSPARPFFNQRSGTPSSITGAEGVPRWRGLSPCTCFSRSRSGSTSPSVQRSVRVLTAPS